jgi:hypothetical protein
MKIVTEQPESRPVAEGALLLKVRDAAVILGCTRPSEVYAMVSSGIIPPAVIVRLGRRLRFSKSGLMTLLASKGALPESAPVRDAAPRSEPASRRVKCPTCATDIIWVEPTQPAGDDRGHGMVPAPTSIRRGRGES